jgi:membrane fusion protein (multidrug efflux system)
MTTDEARVLPLEALVRFAGVNKVFRVRDGKAQEVLVKLGSRGPDWFEVLADLSAGDQVVTSGQTRLADGTPVTIREETAEQPPPAQSPPEK